MISRFSSRRQRLAHSFLMERLHEAKAYDRIAGYFSSSVLEVAGEALESVEGQVRIVCNSDLDARDVETARAAHYAMRREWCAAEPEKLPPLARPRFQRLYDHLKSGKMVVRVLPTEKFGLVHGKAGVITMANGHKTAFLGSTNETQSGWQLNYELVWEDDTEEAVRWVQEEFDALWSHPQAIPLAEFIMEDAGRLSKRWVFSAIEGWKENPDPAAPIIESPVYRREFGLWEHQKYFVKRAFDAHRGPHGARFVLADQVGLGKTIQLAMSAMLMALYGSRPVLVIAPKPLLWQWQDEMLNHLDMPSAIWDGRRWIDENEVEYPVVGPEAIRKCPRRVGIVSQGLIVRRSEVVEHLRRMEFECVILDEAHRARRKNLGDGREDEKADANNLLRFLNEISPRTRSMLLATATPVQLYPVEAWDLIDALARENEHVLGNMWSNWKRASEALNVVMGRETLPEEDLALWGWVRNPLPPSDEGRDFALLRQSLRLEDSRAVASGSEWDRLREPDRARVRRLRSSFGEAHNPFIRHIVCRTRKYLEEELNPETNEPYLKPVHVRLYGEGDDEAILLPSYLKSAYTYAEDFCRVLSARVKGSGFLKTLLLRRVGSTIEAGRRTALKMLGDWQDIEEEEDEEEPDAVQEMKTLTPHERELLEQFVRALEANQERDPKYGVVVDLLQNGTKDARSWLAEGCIIFSQYYDSVWWLAERLSTEIFPIETIGIYAGASKSGIIEGGRFHRVDREELKQRVSKGTIRLVVGTDAASEGLNLQRLGTLINLDLPWNPTRLEQRKGRIQRIGQIRDTVYLYNMRYKDSVEDRVHDLLSDRLEGIYQLFGQLPDVLEDVWIDIALGEIDRARKTIDAVPEKHPFELRYSAIAKVEWESCASVLGALDKRDELRKGW